MDILHLFTDHHYKSIVSIIRERHVLTLHLSTANCRRELTTGCCWRNVAALYCTHYAIYFYQIESYHGSLSCGPLSMHFNGTLILLYFIEMLPHMVSINYNNLTLYHPGLIITSNQSRCLVPQIPHCAQDMLSQNTTKPIYLKKGRTSYHF